jgi:hypothetical protein
VLAWQEWFQEFYGGDEVAFLDVHREIDGIEVGFTAETAPEIGISLDVGLRFAAAWTNKDELSQAALAGPAEVLDQPVDRNLVS